MNVLPPVTDCCAPDCDEAASVEIPGSTGATGADGSDGSDGVNAYTTVTAQFTMPAVGATVVVQVGDSSWMAIGQKIFVQNAGYFDFATSTSSTNATLRNLGYTGNVAPATAVAASNKVSPGGVAGADGADGTDPTTELTTKGDLLTRNATVNVRLAVGSNGQVLLADSTQTTGNKWGALDLSASGVSRTNDLPIADGGTGQGTKQAAFDALSPVTTRGDLIIRDASNNVRLPIGTANKVLCSDGTDPSWRKIVASDINFADGPLPRYGLLGSLVGADFNIITDQAISIQTGVSSYVVRRIVVVGASVNMTTAAGGVYTGAGKVGAIVGAGQVYTALTASTKFVDLTLTGAALTDALTGAFLYLSLSTPQGAAATANVYVFGENLT